MDWQLVLSLAWYHSVGPLVYRTLNTACADLVPKESLDMLRHRTQAGTLLNRALAHELVQVCQAFNESGIPLIAFKGVPLAVMAYQDPILRDFDDLDLIVPQARLADAQKVLWSQGFRPLSRSRDEFQTCHFDEPYHVFVKKNSPTPVDLQWVMAHEQFAFRLDRADIYMGSLCPDVDQWPAGQDVGSRRVAHHTLCARVQTCMGATEMGGGRCRAASLSTAELGAGIFDRDEVEMSPDVAAGPRACQSAYGNPASSGHSERHIRRP